VTEHQDNRPERIGAMRAAMQSIEAAATSAAAHFAGAEYHSLLLAAMREIGQAAWGAVTADDDRQSADRAAFEKHLAEREQAQRRRCPDCDSTNFAGNVCLNCGGAWAEMTPAERAALAAEQVHECGTPAPGAVDTSDYPARMVVLQRDPADPESWIFRCGERHASNGAAGIGWQSPDYASEDDALIAAGDHARAMHDMGLPNALAERVAAAEQAAAAPDADHSSDGGFRYPVNHGGR
jgi:hypothetical protein